MKMKTIETKNSTLKNMNHQWSGKNDLGPCARNTLSKTIWVTVNTDQNWWKFVQCSWTRFMSQLHFQQGKCVCINSVCVNYCVCRCVCVRERLQRWSSYDYFGCWSRFRLEGQYVSSPGLVATPDQMAWTALQRADLWYRREFYCQWETGPPH